MSDSLGSPYTVRTPTLDDVEDAVALLNACSIALIGRPQWEAHQLRNDWQSPDTNPDTDLRVVVHESGAMVGYAGVWDVAPHVRLYGWADVHPQWHGRGIGTFLAGWLESRVRRAIPGAPPGARVVVEQSRLVLDRPAADLLLARGYQLARYFSRMRIDLDGPPPPARFPEGVEISTYAIHAAHAESPLRDLVLAENDIFRDHWGFVEQPLEQDVASWQHWIDNNPDHDPTVWFLAMAADGIAGVALCDPKTTEDPEMSYVMSLGVRRAYRRRGVGLALLHHAFGEFHRRGMRAVALDVDAESLTGATRLYERAGMHVDRQSASYVLELRPGDDLSTQAL